MQEQEGYRRGVCLGAVPLPQCLLEEAPSQVLEETTVLWESKGLASSLRSATNRLCNLGPVAFISRFLFSHL